MLKAGLYTVESVRALGHIEDRCHWKRTNCSLQPSYGINRVWFSSKSNNLQALILR